MIKLKIRRKSYYSDGPYLLVICDEEHILYYQFDKSGYHFLGTSEDFIDGAHLGEIVPKSHWSEMVSDIVDKIVQETEADRVIYCLETYLKSS